MTKCKSAHLLLNDDTWEHEMKGDRKDFFKDEWKEKQKSWTYDYTDSYDGEVIPTTIYVDEDYIEDHVLQTYFILEPPSEPPPSTYKLLTSLST